MPLISYPPHRCFRTRPIVVFAPSPSQPRPLSRPPPRSRCKPYRAMQTRTCPALRDANTNVQPLCYARAAPVRCGRSRCFHGRPLPTRTPLRSAPADANAPAQPHCGSSPIRRQCPTVLCLRPRGMYLYRRQRCPNYAGRGGHYPTRCPAPAQSLPAAHHPKASSCERARTVQTNAAPPLVSYPPPCAGSPCPAVTFATASARCKRLRTRPHARHANIRPPNHANECERAPPRR
ncbi:hypothetical protein B0H13DRAFT_2658096 [Mycena leptocephala]|nr:hypothetical protein B0H13DRAFT_2658096 [Mycena leptocephala]